MHFLQVDFHVDEKKTKRTIDLLPDNLTIEELIVVDEIEQELNDANEDRVYTTEEAKQKLSKWLQ